MKLWQKEIDIDQKIENFTIGRDKEFDIRLAPFDVRASKAHAKMLFSIDLLTEAELNQLLKGLDEIDSKIADGKYVIQDGVEDIHSQIEFDLIELTGDVGKKIHAGRSRNDQVLVALNLYFRAELEDIHSMLVSCVNQFLEKANMHKEFLMPGYTHSQIGMVSTFGMWFGAFAESLIQDANYLSAIRKLVDQNPLGSAAGYGSSFPLDRELTTSLLEFGKTAINPIFAQMTRGKSELLICQGLTSMSYTIGKFASDICLFVNGDFNFLKLPDQLTTGSSIMPHKKNPDVFELIRAKCNQLAATPNQISLLTHNLMTGYHRDFQLIKEVVFPALDMAKDIIELVIYCIPQIEVRKYVLDDKKYDHLFSVEEVNKLVLAGMPFREAYQKISKQIESGNFVAARNVKHTHLGSIGNLGLDEISQKLK